ncbi:pyridoxal phosphate-dependent aminotransferase [Paucibacter sp. DJ1R-11]|uniref:pyridoxal phosphate-dependent aminotransferase n=1 Tax=Paucibacter sp. DJ1R-11 TaxID=2893556 RepID=UPI0021E42B01|nr:pyridoxal phosphate-dependent aminotransferase [Paucibacter sp. DJ1R-11]MCV2365332.1 pyridoxal phosphate-dependent aminotransferase [Paucibacter sp. DJ1R-11]
MNFETPALISRLPRVGATIFSTMSALAQAHGAVNLGQGFPDFDCDPALIEAVHQAMQTGHNQYPPMPGVPALREAVAAKLLASHGMAYCPEREITITAGATQAILTALLAIVHPGDEVMVLEPCYDSYAPNVELAGGVLVRVPLDPHSFRPDFERIRAALSPRTRAIIINTPHNPSATVWSAQEMLSLAELLRGTSVLLISDEVYEHMVFDGAAHQSVARFPELAARSLIVSSFGKTFHVTGWKVGYVAAPASLSAEFRKVHQYTVFSVNTPVQLGLARYLEDPRPHQSLPAFYQRKRDHFRAGLAASRLRLLPCSGSYFQCVDYRELGKPSELNDSEFCQWLTREVGVAAIPISAFHNSKEDQMRASELKIIRFCFAKQDSTLDHALTLLKQL